MKIIIVGKGASGKDHLLKRMVKQGGIYDPSYTTRPPREGEKHGVDYYFISQEEFELVDKNAVFFEEAEFAGHKYGITIRQWVETNLFIMTPSGLAQVPKEDRKECFVIYLDIDKEIRMKRLAERSDFDSVERRIAADEEDFKDFTDYDMIVHTPTF